MAAPHGAAIFFKVANLVTVLSVKQRLIEGWQSFSTFNTINVLMRW